MRLWKSIRYKKGGGIIKNIFVKTYNGEIDIEFWAEIEYKRVLLIMKQIEETFLVDMSEHPKLKKTILDTANFIRRMPSEIVEINIVRTDIT